jgi:stage V sporulation protein B
VRTNVLSRSVVANVLGQAASLGLGFCSSVVLARWLGPSGRGLLAIMLSVTGVVYILTAVGLPYAVEYRVSRDRSESGALLGNTLPYGAVLGALTIPLFWVLRQPFADVFAHGRGGDAWILVGVLAPLNFVSWVTSSQLSGVLRFRLSNLIYVGSRATYTLAVLLLLTVAGLGVTAGLVASGIAACVLTVGSLAALLRNGRPRLDRRVFGAMLSYGSRIQVSAIFQTLNYRLDVLILQFFRPLSQVGVYVVAQIVAELTTSLSFAFGGVLPIVSGNRREEERARTTVNSIRHHAILAAVAVCATAAFGPLLISVGFGHRFHSAIAPMLLLLPGIWFLGTGTVATSNLSGHGRPGLSAALAGLAASVTVALDLALIPRLGIYGAVVASLASYTTYGITSLVALSRVTGIGVRELFPGMAELRLYPEAAGRLLAVLRRTSTVDV